MKLSELASTMDEDADALTRAFFDLQTGAIEYVPFELQDETLFADVLDDPDRWQAIVRLSSRDRLAVRARFVDDLADPQSRLQFQAAMGATPPNFSAFARLLRQHPSLGAAWLAVRDAYVGHHARRWLADMGIRPVDR